MPSLDQHQNDGTLCAQRHDPVTGFEIKLIVVFTLEATGGPRRSIRSRYAVSEDYRITNTGNPEIQKRT
jgi:hypothetical protein